MVGSERDYVRKFLSLHYRVPQSVGDLRFGNWLANARDWNVSRNRYWGTPLPLWVSDDYEEVRMLVHHPPGALAKP